MASVFIRRALCLCLLALTLSACTTMRQPREATWDPLERWNRRVFAFNDTLDRFIMKPVADAYLKAVPSPMRTAVTNFFDNITYINVIANSFLQGKGKQGFSDTGRFIINSTVGLGGLVDVATAAGVPRNDEDFGQTLAVWGFGEGAYLMLPLLGPSTFRDAPGYAFSAAVHPFTYWSGEPVATASLGALAVVDQRAQVKGAFELINAAALDRYIFIREAYRQRRIYLIYDGNPPVRVLEVEKPAPAK